MTLTFHMFDTIFSLNHFHRCFILSFKRLNIMRRVNELRPRNGTIKDDLQKHSTELHHVS